MKKLLLVLTVVAMASFLFVGCLGGTVTPPENNAPVITSTEVTSVTLPAEYTYTVVATDADEDALTYSVAGPTGMAISTAGVITWAPAAAGSNAVIVTVSDGTDSVTQSFTIVVEPAPVPENNAPVITSTAVTSVTLPAEYTYTVVATDEDDLTYDLIPLTGFVPAGMTISSAGVISWAPTVVGVYPVTVEVSDGELTDTQSFTVTVSAEPVGPTVDSLLLLEAIVGEPYAGQVIAPAGDDLTLTYSLVGATGDMAISATGLITWTPDTAGDQLVTVVVTDGAGLSDTKDFTIVVDARVAPEIAAIDDQTITWGEDFEYPVTLAAGTDPTPTYALAATRVANAIGLEIDAETGLITWNPLEVQTGLYEVTVTATDTFDSSLSDTEVFTILVVDPEPPEPLSATIVYAPTHSYNDGTTKFVRGGSGDDCVGVTVTLSEAVGEDDEVQIRWNDGEDHYGPGPGADDDWLTLYTTDNIVYTTDDPTTTVVEDGLCFTVDEVCELVCVEVQLVIPDEFCSTCEGSTAVIHTETVKVDSAAPCASFVVTIADCGVVCGDKGAEMSWTTLCEGDCGSVDCCCDDCSGVGDWSFTLDYVDECTAPCDTESGSGCSIAGAFECGCLLYEGEGEEPANGIHTIDISIKDNVGNEITDIWTIAFDSQGVITFESLVSVGAEICLMDYDTDEVVTSTYNVDYSCPDTECDDCCYGIINY